MRIDVRGWVGRTRVAVDICGGFWGGARSPMGGTGSATVDGMKTTQTTINESGHVVFEMSAGEVRRNQARWSTRLARLHVARAAEQGLTVDEYLDPFRAL